MTMASCTEHASRCLDKVGNRTRLNQNELRNNILTSDHLPRESSCDCWQLLDLQCDWGPAKASHELADDSTYFPDHFMAHQGFDDHRRKFGS